MEGKEQKKVNTSLRLLVKSSAVVFMGIILSKLITYVYKIVIARGFGPEVYGLFSLSMMILGLFAAFASFGLIDGITRYIPFYNGKKQHDKARYIFKWVFAVILISSIIFGAALFLLADYISVQIFHNAGLIIYLKIFAFLVPISTLSSLYLAAIRAFQKITLYSFIVNIFQSAIKLLALGLFIYAGIGETSVPLSYLIGILMMLVVAYVFSRYYVSSLFKKSKIREDVRKETLSELLSYSWPIMFLGLISVIFGWVDSFVIGSVRNVSEVGFYNAALTLCAFFGISSDLFMQMFFPLIVKEYAKANVKLVEEVSKQVAKWIYVLNLPLFIIVFLFPGAIINIFFGKEYLVAETALRILSVGGLMSSLITLGSNLLSMEGRSKMILSNLVIASLVNLGLNLLLVPKYGMIGAASATSFVWIALSVVVFLEVKKYTSIVPLRRKMIGVTLVSIIPTLLLILAKQYVPLGMINVLLLGTLFLVFYLVLIFLTGCLDRNDLMIIDTVKAKFGLAKR